MYKKIISVLAVFAIVSAVCAFPVYGAEYTKDSKFMWGDVDFDGAVTVKDATLIQKFIAKTAELTLMQRYLADVGGFGITVRCATQIQKYIAKIVPLNTKTGATPDMAAPTMLDSTVSLEKPAEGKDIPIAQTEHIAFDNGLGSTAFYEDSDFIIFTENHYTLYDLFGTEIANRYTDNYFIENALIVMSLHGSSAIRHRVNSVCVDNGILGVNYSELILASSEFGDDVMISDDVVNSRVYIEVKKADIEEITDIETYRDFGTYEREI